MTFLDEINKIDLKRIKAKIYDAEEADVERVLEKDTFSINDFRF